MNDLTLSPIKYDKECKYLHDLDDKNSEQSEENIRDLLSYCAKLRLYMSSKMQINAHNKTAHHILKNEVDLISNITEDIKPCIKQLVLCQLKQIYKKANLCI